MTLPALFLPGILLPAAPRYEKLFAALGGGRELVARDLAVYTTPPERYSIATEVEAIARFADERGWQRFHLYGHSGGGACALAFAATYPDRLATLALDEPAFDFSAPMRALIEQLLPALDLPPQQALAAFGRANLRAGVEPPPPPPGPPPPWMASRPAGIAAIVRAFTTSDISLASLATFDRPIYYSHGSLSHERWLEMAQRLVALVPLITVECFAGRSHFDTSHAGEPDRVARSLHRLWSPD